jgi:hypothetical protein
MPFKIKIWGTNLIYIHTHTKRERQRDGIHVASKCYIYLRLTFKDEFDYMVLLSPLTIHCDLSQEKFGVSPQAMGILTSIPGKTNFFELISV